MELLAELVLERSRNCSRRTLMCVACSTVTCLATMRDDPIRACQLHRYCRRAKASRTHLRRRKLERERPEPELGLALVPLKCYLLVQRSVPRLVQLQAVSPLIRGRSAVVDGRALREDRCSPWCARERMKSVKRSQIVSTLTTLRLTACFKSAGGHRSHSDSLHRTSEPKALKSMR